MNKQRKCGITTFNNHINIKDALLDMCFDVAYNSIRDLTRTMNYTFGRKFKVSVKRNGVRKGDENRKKQNNYFKNARS